MASSRILVAGATGRVGGAVVDGLRREGADVAALLRDPGRGKALAAQGVALRQGDLDDPASLRAALSGIDGAFLASADGKRQVAQERAFIQAAREAGVRHIVKLSAQSAGLDPPQSFGAPHREAEIALERSGVPFTILRPTFFMQSVLLFAADIRRKGRFMAPIRRGRVAMVDLRDAAAVAVRCLLDPGHQGAIHVVTGGRAVDFAEVARVVGAAAARDVKFASVPPMLARVMLPIAAGMPRWHAGMVVDLFVALEAGAQAEPTDAVERITGAPPRRFEDFARENAAAFALQSRLKA